jgi:hypothetical protein
MFRKLHSRDRTALEEEGARLAAFFAADANRWDVRVAAGVQPGAAPR